MEIMRSLNIHFTEQLSQVACKELFMGSVRTLIELMTAERYFKMIQLIHISDILDCRFIYTIYVPVEEMMNCRQLLVGQTTTSSFLPFCSPMEQQSLQISSKGEFKYHG